MCNTFRKSSCHPDGPSIAPKQISKGENLRKVRWGFTIHDDPAHLLAFPDDVRIGWTDRISDLGGSDTVLRCGEVVIPAYA